VRRIAGKIENQQQLDAVLAQYPSYLRAAWFEELRPYLKFKPGSVLTETS